MRSRIIHYFLALLLVSNHIFASLDDNAEFVPCEKTYIQSQQIEFIDRFIIVNVGNSIIQTSGIFADQTGFYFKDYRKGDCEEGEWQCKICDTCNPYWNTSCKECNRINWNNQE